MSEAFGVLRDSYPRYRQLLDRTALRIEDLALQYSLRIAHPAQDSVKMEKCGRKLHST